MVSAGIFCTSGFPLTHMACDYFDYQVYLPWPEVSDRSISFVNGLDLIIEEPLQRILVRYRNEARNTSLDLAYTAVMPAVPRKRAMHNEAVQRVGYDVGGLEQTMRVEGEIRLGGQVIPVDTQFVRDRSYGQLRSEAAGSGPPFGWQSGSFGADFSFGILGIEDPKRNPCWADAFQVPPDRTLFSGWVCRDAPYDQAAQPSDAARVERSVADRRKPVRGFDGSPLRSRKRVSHQPWGLAQHVAGVGLTEFRMQGRRVGSSRRSCAGFQPSVPAFSDVDQSMPPSTLSVAPVVKLDASLAERAPSGDLVGSPMRPRTATFPRCPVSKRRRIRYKRRRAGYCDAHFRAELLCQRT
jgi:hypothetical protein